MSVIARELEKLTDGGFPVCRKCKSGVLVTLSDFTPSPGGGVGVAIQNRAWVCTSCGATIEIYKGKIFMSKATNEHFGPR